MAESGQQRPWFERSIAKADFIIHEIKEGAGVRPKILAEKGVLANIKGVHGNAGKRVFTSWRC